MLRNPLVVANWKMHGSRALCDEFSTYLKPADETDLWIATPTVYLSTLNSNEYLGSFVKFGVQNVHSETSGAFTGEVSAAMAKDAGATFAIVGHSERRTQHQESDQFVAEKFQACIDAGITPILCIGETLTEREADQATDVVRRQLLSILNRCGDAAFQESVIAYEPVWAIGTGKTATPAQAQSMHSQIRDIINLDQYHCRILYGGSVNPDNVQSLWHEPDIDGFLVGGASLNPVSLMLITQIQNSN